MSRADEAHPDEVVEFAPPKSIEESPFHRRTRWGDMRSLQKNVAENGLVCNLVGRWIFVGRNGERIPAHLVDERKLRTGKRVRELIIGHRRRRAAESGNLDVVPIVMRELTDEEVIEHMSIENSEREDNHPLDECDHYHMLIERGHDRRTLARRFSRPPSYIDSRLLLARLVKSARSAYAKDQISDHAARIAARLPIPTQQAQLVDALVTGAISDDEIVTWVRNHAFVRLDDVEWSLTDENLPGGACSKCTKRTTVQRELFEPIAGADDLCADPKCWRGKMDAVMAVAVEAAPSVGAKFVTGDPMSVFMQTSDGGRPVVMRSSGMVDARGSCPAVPGKTWLDAAAAAGLTPALILRADQDGRPRYLLEEKAVAGKIRRAVRDEPESNAAKAEAAADPARARVREEKTARAKAEEALIAALLHNEPKSEIADLAPVLLALTASRLVSLASVRRVARIAKVDQGLILAGQTDEPVRVLAALLVAEVGIEPEAAEIGSIATLLDVKLPAT